MDEPRTPDQDPNSEVVHASIARWERRWLAASALISLTFVILIAWNLATDGAHIAQRSSRAQPEVLLSGAMFQQPGLRTLAPGSYQLTLVAQAFNFTPAVVTVPVGAEVEFFVASRDVIHGYQLERTNVNVELIPGEVSRFRYTFDKPGSYRASCNEYCGISHHAMLGRIEVVPTSTFAALGSGSADMAAQAAGPAGEALYGANCASCHQANGQGLAGVFPPLTGHAPDLYREQGRDYLATLMLYGLQGEIVVDGQSYNGAMPAWAQLSDDEIAALLDYVLTAWGNADALPDDYTPIGADEIAAQRERDLSATDVWTLRQGGTP